MDVMVRDDVMGEFANALRPGVGEQVAQRLADVFAMRSTDEWLGVFADAGVPLAAVGDPEDWLTSGLVAKACQPVAASHPDIGTVVMPGTPVSFDRSATAPGAPGGTRGRVGDVWPAATPPSPPEGDPPTGTPPLEGLRVVDTSTFLAAPFISALLAEQGADVVKVETATGDPYQAFPAAYSLVNQHKRRLRIDLRDDGARADFFELVGRADVVVDNLLPVSLDRLGLTHDAFEQANQRVVRCSVTAFGQGGPWAELPGFDPLLQSMSGLASVQGGDGRPITTGAPVHDIATGALGALGCLAALYVRVDAERGQRVFVSLAATSTLLQSGEITQYAHRPQRSRGGPNHPGPTPWCRYYPTAQGWLAVAAQTPAAIAALLESVGCPELQGASADGAVGRLTQVFASGSADSWARRLGAADVPACVVTPMYGLDDPALVEERYTTIVDSPESGRFQTISGFVDWSGTPRRPQVDHATWLVDVTEMAELLQ